VFSLELRAPAGVARGADDAALPGVWNWRANAGEFRGDAAGQGRQRHAAGRGRAERAYLVREGIVRINYEHIPPQTIQSPAVIHAVRADVRIAAKHIGYVMDRGRGAGGAQAARLRGDAARSAELEQADFRNSTPSSPACRPEPARDLRRRGRGSWEYVGGRGTVWCSTT